MDRAASGVVVDDAMPCSCSCGFFFDVPTKKGWSVVDISIEGLIADSF